MKNKENILQASNQILEQAQSVFAFSTQSDKTQQLVQVAIGMSQLASAIALSEIAEILKQIAQGKEEECIPVEAKEQTEKKTGRGRKRNGEPAGAEITS